MKLKMQKPMACKQVKYFIRTIRFRFTVTTSAVKAQTELVQRSSE